MGKKKEFFEKPVYTVTNYIFWFLLGGVYFFLTNILLIIFMSATSINPDDFNLLLFFIALLPLGPSVSALTSTMREILNEKSINFSSYFFNSYKKNFKSTIKVWSVFLALIFIMFIDFQLCYLNLTNTGLYIVFAILGIYLAILTLYAIPINSRFKVKLKDIFVLSAYYSMKKLHFTVLKIIILGGSLFIGSKMPLLLSIFLPSIALYVVSFYDNIILNDIEEKHLSN